MLLRKYPGVGRDVELLAYSGEINESFDAEEMHIPCHKKGIGAFILLVKSDDVLALVDGAVGCGAAVEAAAVGLGERVAGAAVGWVSVDAEGEGFGGVGAEGVLEEEAGEFFGGEDLSEFAV